VTFMISLVNRIFFKYNYNLTISNFLTNSKRPLWRFNIRKNKTLSLQHKKRKFRNKWMDCTLTWHLSSLFDVMLESKLPIPFRRYFVVVTLITISHSVVRTANNSTKRRQYTLKQIFSWQVDTSIFLVYTH
jgi:hypothetical protein